MHLIYMIGSVLAMMGSLIVLSIAFWGAAELLFAGFLAPAILLSFQLAGVLVLTLWILDAFCRKGYNPISGECVTDSDIPEKVPF